MAKNRAQIERRIGRPMLWERLEGKKASRIKSEVHAENFYGRFADETNWLELIAWFRKEMNDFYKAVSPIWEQVETEVG